MQGFAMGYSLDFAMVFIGIYSAVVAYIRTMQEWPSKRIWCKKYFILFFGIFVLALMYWPLTRTPNIAIRKFTWLFFSAGSILIPAIFLQSYKYLREFLAGYCLLVIPLCLITILSSQNLASYERARFLQANPLAMADMAGIAAIIVLASAIFGKSLISKLWLIVVPIFILAIFKSGSRGSLMAVPFAIAFMGLMLGAKSSVRSLVIMGIGGIVVFFAVLQGVDWASTRFSLESVQGGTNVRFELWASTLEGTFERLPFIGGGTGDSTYILTGLDKWEGIYPHNPFIEIFSELGILGLAMLCWLIWLPLQAIWSMRQIPTSERRHSASIFILAAIVMYLIIMCTKSACYASWFNGYFWISLFLHAHLRFFVYDNRNKILLADNAYQGDANPDNNRAK